MKHNAFKIALVIVAISASLIFLDRLTTPNIHAQADPNIISNQWDGGVSVKQTTNGNVYLYLPGGFWTTLPFGTNAVTAFTAGTGTITALSATTATITTSVGGQLTNDTLFPIALYLPTTNGATSAVKLFVSKYGTNLVLVSGTTTSTFVSVAGTAGN